MIIAVEKAFGVNVTSRTFALSKNVGDPLELIKRKAA
jgi:hypothetical protein